MAHVVKCRICKQQFDTTVLPEEEWIMPNPRYYYHKKCYEDWSNNRNNVSVNGRNEQFWWESMIDYLYRDVKAVIDFSKITSQWECFTKPERKMTPKGIYFAIRYYYDVLNGKAEKAQGGIGIVPSIYKESAQYWTELENKKAGTLEAITEQIKKRSVRPMVLIKDKSKEKTEKWKLDNL